MSRPAVIAAAILLTLSAVFAQAVLFPGPALACSCAGPPPPLAEIAAADDVAIIAGSVGPALADRTPVAVDAWFHGAARAELVWLSGGTQQMSSCDILMSPGERRLFVLYGSVEGMYSANSCSPSGRIGTAEGDALVAEAMQAFGAPQPPPTTEPEPEPPAAPQNQPAAGDGGLPGGPGLLWIGAGVGLAVLLFGAVILVARVRRAD
jgi:hypothetical protein